MSADSESSEPVLGEPILRAPSGPVENALRKVGRAQSFSDAADPASDDRGMPERPRYPVGDAADRLIPPEERERERREMEDPAPAPGEPPVGNAGGSGGSGGGGSGDGGSGSGDGGSGGDGGDGGGSGGGDAAMGGEDDGTEHDVPLHFGGVSTSHGRGVGERLGHLVDPSHLTQPHADPRVTDPNPG